ncbi:MAG: aminopeptidase P family protein [Nitriliruptoraceae bacterium]|nr:aminopeptidase P family protein [Nitriliruptoraceae bacterium]
MSAPAHDHAGRREAIRQRLAGADTAADWLLVTDPRNVRYLSGFHGSNGQVLLGPSAADDRLITDRRYAGRAASEAPGLDAVLDRDAPGVALATAGSGAALAVEAEDLSWAAGRALTDRAREAGVRPVPTTGLVEAARAVKDDAEVARITTACAITQTALAAAIEHDLRPGVSERDLAVALERRFVDAGADGVAFPSIVASGPNGAVPHHEPTDRPCAPGELVTIDCGALVDGYHADHTRTVPVPGGAPEPQLVAVHALVVEAQAAGRGRAGVRGRWREGVTTDRGPEATQGRCRRGAVGVVGVHGRQHASGV